MDLEREHLIRRIRSTPPRCLSQLTCRFDERPAIEQNGHTYSAWSIACLCGSRWGRFLGNENPGPEYLGPPLAFECAKCGEKREILDVAQHGFGGELRSSEAPTNQPSGCPREYSCPACTGAEFAVSCVFVIPDEALYLAEDDLIEETGLGYAENIQNLFDQFSAECTCAACKLKSFAASMELK